MIKQELLFSLRYVHERRLVEVSAVNTGITRTSAHELFSL